MVVIRIKPYKPYETIDDGEWLRPMLISVRSKTLVLPDDETVARIREQVLHLIAQESIPLVA